MSLSDDLPNFYLGRASDQNPHSNHVGGLRDYDDSYKTKHYIKNALDEMYEKAIRGSHQGSWYAYVLHSKVEYKKSPHERSISHHLGKTIMRIKVTARIPELDAAIPQPKMLGLVNELNLEDQMALSMHRVFYSMQSPGGTSKASIPSVGDIIKVDFEDRNKHMFGVYLGIHEKGVGSIPDGLGAYAPTIASGKAQSYFKDRFNRRKLVGLYEPIPAEIVTQQRNQEFADLIGVPSHVVATLRGEK